MAIEFDNLAAAYAWLDGHINYERRLGSVQYNAATFELERFRELMRRLGDPQRGARSIHVAGSCGKGSSCLFLEAILRGLGFKTATYASPHPKEYRERVRIDGVPLAPERFCRYLEMAASLAPPDDSSTGSGDFRDSFRTVFEFLTAIFFLAAREQRVDWMIVETGLGGRLDATNVLDPGPVLWTKISLEHTRMLGPTVAAIAAEKAAILKPGGWAVAAAQEPGGRAEAVFRARSEDTGADWISAPAAAPLLRANYDEAGMELAYRFMGRELAFRAPIYGPFLADNLQGALAVIAGLAERGAIPAPLPERLASILSEIRLPGRMEPVAAVPGLFSDAGHCPAAARAVAEAMRDHFGASRAIAVVGMVDDKDHDSFFRELASWPGWRRVICYTPANPRALPGAALAERARPHLPQVESRENLALALELAVSMAEDKDKIIATGTAFSAAGTVAWGSQYAAKSVPLAGPSQAPAQAFARPSEGNP